MDNDLWHRLVRMCLTLNPAVPNGGLLPGASCQLLDSVEQAMGLDLPSDLRNAYLYANGMDQAGHLFTLFPDGFGWVALSTADRSPMLRTWRSMSAMLAEQKAEDADFDIDRADNERYIDECGGTVYARYLDLGRALVATRHIEDGLFVDTRPAKAGRPGQLIYADPQDPDCKCLSPSFSSAVKRMVLAYESGRIHFDPEDGWIHLDTGRDVSFWELADWPDGEPPRV